MSATSLWDPCANFKKKVFYMAIGAPEATWINREELPLREY